MVVEFAQRLSAQKAVRRDSAFAGMTRFANDNHGCDVEGYVRVFERLQSELLGI